MKKLSMSVCALGAVLLSSWMLAYGQATEISPTPAPSKTPSGDEISLTELSPTATDTATISMMSELPQAYSQADLSVLVGNVQRPNGIFWLNDQLYTACHGDWTLYQINARTGSTITLVFGIQNAYTLYGESTTADAFDLWIPDYDRNQLSYVNQTRAAPRVIASNLDGPWGIAKLDDEHFLVSSFRANKIIRISRDGDTQDVVQGLRSPAGVVIHEDRLFFANTGSARRAIEWLPLTDLNQPIEDITPRLLVGGLQSASSLVLANDGYLYFTYALGSRGVVGRIHPSSCLDEACTNDQVEVVLYTELPSPLVGLTISPDMRLFVHAIYRPEIYWVDLYQS